jgi:Na+/melibiose symporter-like transporter
MSQGHYSGSESGPARSLWQNSDFLKLWAGQTVSTIGSGVTASALPLIAVLVLGAQASDMGWLLALESAPVLVMGLLAGVWVDRLPRRPLLVGADLGRAGLLACIPLLAFVGGLRLEHLYVVAATTGALTVLFDVAYRSFIPDLVGRQHVLEANSRLASVEAVAEITTPGLTGALVQVIAPATAILLDAASFVASALCVASIRHTDPPRSTSKKREDVLQEIAIGLQAVRNNKLLSRLAIWGALRNFFGMFIGALYVLYALRELGLTPLLVGLSVGVGGVSNLVGTMAVQPITRRFGIGQTMTSAVLVGCITPVVIALAPVGAVPGFVVLAAAQVLDWIHPLYDVNALTIRQRATPPHLLGRVNATLHVVERGVIPFGAVAGGMLGDAIGVRPTLVVAALGITLGAVWLARSGVLRHGLTPADSEMSRHNDISPVLEDSEACRLSESREQ